MSRRPSTLGRLATFVCGMALVAAACSSLPTGDVTIPQGRRFIPLVPDSVDDVGLGSAIALDDQGLPYISYLGFPGELEPGEIPVTRPVGSPFLTTEDGKDASAVLLAHLTPDQIWDRGAVAQPRETPSGFQVPFGPAYLPSLVSMTAHNARGTDIALSGSDIHVAWGSDTGVWYGIGPDFKVGTVEKTRSAGRPSIAIDGSGAPIVAYAVAGTRPQIRIADRVGEKWRITTVAELSACGTGCPPEAQVGLVGGEPLVVVADPKSGELVAAQRKGTTWSTEVVATGVTGGTSLTAAGNDATIAFYADGGVSVATGRFGDWSVQEVASVKAAEESPSPSASGAAKAPPAPDPTTGVAVDGQGTTWVSWQDAEGIHLASSDGSGSFQQTDLSNDTSGGVTPSVAVTEDGATVYLTWYDLENADLRLGTYGEPGDLLVAAPSPTPAVVTAAPTSCGADKKIQLSIVAKNVSFDPNCLVAPAAKAFTIEFDNQDPASVGDHNIVIAVDEAATATNPIFRGDLVAGPAKVAYDVPAIPDPGNYFFHCEVHPTTMIGTLAVVAGK